MRELCSNVVARMDNAWPFAGWVVFVCFLFLPMVAQQFWLWIPLAVVTLVWWTIDAADQNVPGWTVPLGLLLIAAGMAFLYGGWWRHFRFATGAAWWWRYFWCTTGTAWCLYWFKLRE